MRFLRWLTFPVLAAGLFALSQAGGSLAQPGPKEKGEKAKDKAKDKAKGEAKEFDKAWFDRPAGPDAGGALRAAYDGLRDVSVQTPAVRERALRGADGLFGQAKEIYRNAVQAQQGGDAGRARELAVAANDAARGLRYLLRGTLPAATDLPAPPTIDAPPPPAGRRGAVPPPPPANPGGPGEPWVASRELLRHTRDRIDSVADLTADGPGKQFLDASRQVYQLAREAYLAKDYSKAADLARAAEAWTHVGEHLQNGDNADAAAPPLPGGRTPPPPPPPGSLGEAPPPRPPAGRGAGEGRTVQGTVRSLMTAPGGELDGATLDDGTVIHWPPHLAERFSAVAGRGEQVRATGRMEAGPAGDTRLEVRSVTNLRTNQTAQSDGGPPPE